MESKICQICKRKVIRPEKSGSAWYFSRRKICDNCMFYKDGKYDKIHISTKKIVIRSIKGIQKYQSLSIIDVTNNELIGEYIDSEILKKDFIAYKNRNSENEIVIIDRMYYHNLTNHFQ